MNVTILFASVLVLLIYMLDCLLSICRHKFILLFKIRFAELLKILVKSEAGKYSIC